MLEDLISAFVRSQFGDVKRRTKGALLEAVALGMAGLATLFLSVGLYLLLATWLEEWLSALIVSAIAFSISGVLALVGRSLLVRKDRQQYKEMMSGLEALSILTRKDEGSGDSSDKHHTGEPRAAVVGAALAAGVLLGRSIKR
jgi:hypothetical protein